MDSKKLNAIKKVMQGVKDLSILGKANDDIQIKFIADTMQIVLLAGNNVDHAELMAYHVSNFLSELQMLDGQITVTEHFKGEEICQN